MPRGVRSIIGGYRSKEHPDYEVWCSMRKRCNYKNGKDFKYYGGRGITYQESWDKFENFISDMGERKNNLLTLDRIDVNKKQPFEMYVSHLSYQRILDANKKLREALSRIENEAQLGRDDLFYNIAYDALNEGDE